MVQMEWWRPRAPDPGEPMEVGSRRTVTIAGHEGSVVHGSTSGGAVHAAFVTADGYQARLEFESCGPGEVDSFLSGLREP